MIDLDSETLVVAGSNDFFFDFKTFYIEQNFKETSLKVYVTVFFFRWKWLSTFFWFFKCDAYYKFGKSSIDFNQFAGIDILNFHQTRLRDIALEVSTGRLFWVEYYSSGDGRTAFEQRTTNNYSTFTQTYKRNISTSGWWKLTFWTSKFI